MLSDEKCTGCGETFNGCGPLLWAQQKKCCPDCSHHFTVDNGKPTLFVNLPGEAEGIAVTYAHGALHFSYGDPDDSVLDSLGAIPLSLLLAFLRGELEELEPAVWEER